MENFRLQESDNVDINTTCYWLYWRHEEDYNPNDDFFTYTPPSNHYWKSDGYIEGYPQPLKFEDYILKQLNSREVFRDGFNVFDGDELILTFYLDENPKNTIKFSFLFSTTNNKWVENFYKSVSLWKKRFWCTSKEFRGIIVNPFEITKRTQHVLWQDYNGIHHSYGKKQTIQ